MNNILKDAKSLGVNVNKITPLTASRNDNIIGKKSELYDTTNTILEVMSDCGSTDFQSSNVHYQVPNTVQIHCDEYDQQIMDLVDTAWSEAGAVKYEELSKEQTFAFLSKFITSQFHGSKKEKLNEKYFNLMQKDGVVTSLAVGQFIRKTLDIEPVTQESKTEK